MGIGKSYHWDELKYQSRYVCETKKEKAVSKEREASSLWIAGSCKQKEKGWAGDWCTQLQMATTGKEAMSSSVFSGLQAKKQFFTECKKSDFEEGGKRERDTSLSLSLSLSLSSHSRFLFYLQLTVSANDIIKLSSYLTAPTSQCLEG